MTKPLDAHITKRRQLLAKLQERHAALINHRDVRLRVVLADYDERIKELGEQIAREEADLSELEQRLKG